jgi:hypothetical protein
MKEIQIKSMCCNMHVVDFFVEIGAFCGRQMYGGGDIGIDLFFHKESFGNVSKSIGCWLLGVFEHAFMISPDLD